MENKKTKKDDKNQLEESLKSFKAPPPRRTENTKKKRRYMRTMTKEDVHNFSANTAFKSNREN